MKKSQWKFINDEIWILTVGGAFQHSKIYKDDIPNNDKRKKEFREGIKRYVRDLITNQYNKIVDEESHIKNIVSLCDFATKKFYDILDGGKLRIGVGQKILNLYLKYLWCLGKIPEPPHCPFDSKIISILDKDSNISWTRLDDLKDYRELVELAKGAANSDSISEWELKNFKRD